MNASIDDVSSILNKYAYVTDKAMWDYFEDEGIVYFPENDSVMSINDSSIEILKRVDGKKRVDEIINDIVSEFGDSNSEMIKNDVIDFIIKCVNQGIVGLSDKEHMSKEKEEL